MGGANMDDSIDLLSEGEEDQLPPPLLAILGKQMDTIQKQVSDFRNIAARALCSQGNTPNIHWRKAAAGPTGSSAAVR